MRAVQPARFGIHGRITATAVDAAWGRDHRHDAAALTAPPRRVIRGRRSGDNVTCISGLTAIAAAMVWSGIEDQAANLGVTSPTYLTPLWGAVGNGSGTPANTDTALFAELARQTVGAGASSPATVSINALCTWLFYFPSPAAAWSVTEAGVFANGSSTAGSGTMLDHYQFGTPLSVSTLDSLILQVAFSVAGS